MTTTIGKREYMPGISYIPGTYQHSHWWSFVFFGWCTCGICHIPTIHQPMSHLQKFPICVNIGSFVVIYARCTPGFGTFVGIRWFLYQDVCPTHARFLAVDIAKLNRKGLCIYQAYTRMLLIWDLLAYARYILSVYYVGAYSWYMSLHKIGTSIFISTNGE